MKTVGDAMVSTLVEIEKRMYSDQVSCMDALKPLSASVTETLEELKAQEDAGSYLLSIPCMCRSSLLTTCFFYVSWCCFSGGSR